MEIILLLTGLIVGALIGFLFAKTRKNNSEETDREVQALQEIVNKTNADLEKEREDNKTYIAELAEYRQKLENAAEKLKKQHEDFDEMRKSLSKEFQYMADKIFQEKTDRFKKENKEGLETLLSPLKERIKEFSEKVDNTHKKDIQERAGLKKELEQLMKLNQQLTTDAQNLTTALRGESKTQGNWGELILERVLENSGLKKGVEYTVQHSGTTDEGRRLQPDVVINLPDDKHIIIDAKVSLVAYEKMTSAVDDLQYDAYLKEHLNSIRKHVKQLSEKNYQQLSELSSPDFVLLFVPVEASFATAIQADKDLFSYSWEKKIVIVTPSTLLATLRTIASVWKYEHQNQNVQEIARQAGNLYDKFHAFVADLKGIGDRIDQASRAHQDATKKLVSGRGNLVTRAEKLKQLGAETKKSLPPELVEQSQEEEDNA